MSSTTPIFGTPRANTFLGWQMVAPVAGALAAQMVVTNRLLAANMMMARLKAAPPQAPKKTAPKLTKPMAKNRKKTKDAPTQKVVTTVYQSKTNSGKSGLVTLAAMPMPKDSTNIQ